VTPPEGWFSGPTGLTLFFVRLLREAHPAGHAATATAASAVDRLQEPRPAPAHVILGPTTAGPPAARQEASAAAICAATVTAWALKAMPGPSPATAWPGPTATTPTAAVSRPVRRGAELVVHEPFDESS
jgi:hypothetical protein